MDTIWAQIFHIHTKIAYTTCIIHMHIAQCTYIAIQIHTYTYSRPNLLHSLGNSVHSHTRNYTKLAFVNFFSTSFLCCCCCSGVCVAGVYSFFFWLDFFLIHCLTIVGFLLVSHIDNIIYIYNMESACHII